VAGDEGRKLLPSSIVGLDLDLDFGPADITYEIKKVGGTQAVPEMVDAWAASVTRGTRCGHHRIG
jgi:hypothetical protein